MYSDHVLRTLARERQREIRAAAEQRRHAPSTTRDALSAALRDRLHAGLARQRLARRRRQAHAQMAEALAAASTPAARQELMLLQLCSDPRA